MRSKQELTSMANELVSLIRKHHGFLDDDGETVRFSRFCDAAAFREELAAESIPSDVFDAAVNQLEQE